MVDYSSMDKVDLFNLGVLKAKEFLTANKIPYPNFHTYAACPSKYEKKLGKFSRYNKLQGALTGYYEERNIFVNVPVTAKPVMKPRFNSWSYPCYKVDRTAVGVVAHELGHYLEHYLQDAELLTHDHGVKWRQVLAKGRKKVTGYEPVPSEAWAESLRLFILNPSLLAEGIPERFNFILDTSLLPSEYRGWREVLGYHPEYVRVAEKWTKA